jgi:hypothetical protein
MLYVGPFKAFMTTVYVWDSIKHVEDPRFVYLRPFAGCRVWKSFGAYAQYEYISDTTTDGRGLRLGVELASYF